MSPLDDLAYFLAHAVVLEDEAATRYEELADAMAVHNNRDVEALFRKMAEEESGHAEALKKWLKQYPEPPENWNEDLDPPVPVD